MSELDSKLMETDLKQLELDIKLLELDMKLLDFDSKQLELNLKESLLPLLNMERVLVQRDKFSSGSDMGVKLLMMKPLMLRILI